MQIDIVRSDTTLLEFTIREAYDAAGNPITDLSAFSWRFHARRRPNDATAVFEKSSSSGHISVSGNKVLVRIDGPDTAAMTGSEKLYCDLEATDSQGRHATMFVSGSPHIILRVIPDVTR